MRIAKMALVTSLVGTAALIFLSYNLEPKLTEISKIDYSDIDNYVKIAGSVTKVKHGEITQFDIDDGTEEIRVVSFERVNVSKGENLEVTGQVDVYYGFLEVKAKKIIKLS